MQQDNKDKRKHDQTQCNPTHFNTFYPFLFFLLLSTFPPPSPAQTLISSLPFAPLPFWLAELFPLLFFFNFFGGRPRCKAQQLGLFCFAISFSFVLDSPKHKVYTLFLSTYPMFLPRDNLSHGILSLWYYTCSSGKRRTANTSFSNATRPSTNFFSFFFLPYFHLFYPHWWEGMIIIVVSSLTTIHPQYLFYSLIFLLRSSSFYYFCIVECVKTGSDLILSANCSLTNSMNVEKVVIPAEYTLNMSIYTMQATTAIYANGSIVSSIPPPPSPPFFWCQ